MSDEPVRKSNPHVCLCSSKLSLFTEDPELEIFKVLSEENNLKVLRGLSKEEIKTPFPETYMGLDEKQLKKAIRALSSVGLITSSKDGLDHIYYLNKSRLTDVERFFGNLAKAGRSFSSQ